VSLQRALKVVSVKVYSLLWKDHRVRNILEFFIKLPFSKSLNVENSRFICQFALLIQSCVVPIDVLGALISWQDELWQFFVQSFSLCVKTAIIELTKNFCLFFIIIFLFSLFWSGLSGLWFVFWIRVTVFGERFLVVVALEDIVVIVGDGFLMFELLNVIFVQHVGDHCMIKILIRIQLNQFLLFSVEDHHEDVKATKGWQLDDLAHNPSLSLSNGDFFLIRVGYYF